MRGDLALGLFERPQHFADAIDADREHEEVDAVQKTGNIAEDQARLAGNDIEPDRRQHQADQDREDGFRNIVAAEADKGRKREHHQ